MWWCSWAGSPARPPTCDPTGRRTLRQETPWFHRGLGSPPPPPPSSSSSSSSSPSPQQPFWRLLEKPHSAARSFQTTGCSVWFFLGGGASWLFSESGGGGGGGITYPSAATLPPQVTVTAERRCASQPASRGNADQVERMKHSWLFFFFFFITRSHKRLCEFSASERSRRNLYSSEPTPKLTRSWSGKWRNTVNFPRWGAACRCDRSLRAFKWSWNAFHTGRQDSKGVFPSLCVKTHIHIQNKSLPNNSLSFSPDCVDAGRQRPRTFLSALRLNTGHYRAVRQSSTHTHTAEPAHQTSAQHTWATLSQ